MDLLTSLSGLLAIALLTPVLLILARHAIASPPRLMKVIFMLGLAAFSAYLYREGLWLLMMIVISNIVWSNSATIGSIIGMRGNYRVTHLLNVAIFVFMVGGWWFMANVVTSDIQPLSETLILSAGIMLSLTILLAVLPWTPDTFKKAAVISPLIIVSLIMQAIACYHEQAWIGVAFYMGIIGVCLSYRRPSVALR